MIQICTEMTQNMICRVPHPKYQIQKNVEAVPINLYLLSNKAENQDSFLDGVRFRNSICQTQGGLIN